MLIHLGEHIVRDSGTAYDCYPEELVIDDLRYGSERIVGLIIVYDYRDLIPFPYHSIAARGEYMALAPHAGKDVPSGDFLPYIRKRLACEWSVGPNLPCEHNELRIGEILEITENTSLKDTCYPGRSLLLRIYYMADAENGCIEPTAPKVAYCPYRRNRLLDLRELCRDYTAGDEICLIAISNGDDSIGILTPCLFEHIKIGSRATDRKAIQFRNRCCTAFR